MFTKIKRNAHDQGFTVLYTHKIKKNEYGAKRENFKPFDDSEGNMILSWEDLYDSVNLLHKLNEMDTEYEYCIGNGVLNLDFSDGRIKIPENYEHFFSVNPLILIWLFGGKK